MLAAALSIASAPARAADPNFPQLTGRIVDNASLLSDADKAQITADLEALEAKSTDQLVVVTLPSLQDFEIEEFGYKLGRHWGIGQQGKDNGVLLIVAPKERKVRIEVGRRLEPLLTDALTKLIIENGILPRFRDDDYPGGIKAGVRDIIAVLSGDGEELRARAMTRNSSRKDLFTIIFMLIWFIVFTTIIWSIIQSMRHGVTGKSKNNGSSSWTQGFGSSPGGGWSSGGGGFSGGGGSFGGGGSSGSW